MKLRLFLIALCLCVGMSAMAQNHNNRGNRGGNRENRSAQSLDMVVDTAIINSMDLEPELVSAVLTLQAQKAEELKALIIKMAQQRQGQQMGPEAIAAMREQMDEFKFEYRMKFRKTIGVDNYITYLEKQLDKRPAMGASAGQGMRGRMGGGAGMGQGMRGNWGGGDQGGNWDGGDQNNDWNNQNGGGFGE